MPLVELMQISVLETIWMQKNLTAINIKAGQLLSQALDSIWNYEIVISNYGGLEDSVFSVKKELTLALSQTHFRA